MAKPFLVKPIAPATVAGDADITLATKGYVDDKVVPVVNALNSTSTTSALSAAQGKALNEGKAANTEVIMVVKHGTSGNTSRPVGASVVYWVGSAEPTNALNDDMWLGEES